MQEAKDISTIVWMWGPLVLIGFAFCIYHLSRIQSLLKRLANNKEYQEGLRFRKEIADKCNYSRSTQWGRGCIKNGLAECCRENCDK